MRADLLDEYDRQVEVEYKGEKYLVRDNGAVCRTRRAGGRKRPLDDVWTFGKPNASTGYMQVCTHIVHRIVAFAFHEQPSEQHVVDHIDTNRGNNRADNLHWVTRLENALSNPITRARIIRCYGSWEAFIEDPSAIAKRDPNLGWMRTVTKEEAEETLRRLLKWAASGRAPRGGQLGDWIFGSADNVPWGEMTQLNQSLTPMAVQRKWNTPCDFPACPDSMGSDPLGEYVDRLRPGTVFFRNFFGEELTEVAGRSAALLAVVGRIPGTWVRDWALAKITVENGRFVHESAGTFNSLEDALNAYSKLLGIDAPSP
jgi:hypothetical protein